MEARDRRTPWRRTRRAAWAAAWVLLGVLFWIVAGGWQRLAGGHSAEVTRLLADHLAEIPWYYRLFEHRTAHRFLPDYWARRAVRAEHERDVRRYGAGQRLAAQGTNVWTAIPVLLRDVASNRRGRGVIAAEILAAVRAEESPRWSSLVPELEGQATAVDPLRHLLNGFSRYMTRYGPVHRRFALIGLAAVGPEASAALPDLLGIFRDQEDHELWDEAATAYRRLGGQPAEAARLLRSFIGNPQGWPNVRASALSALIILEAESPGSRQLLREGLRDEKSMVRLIAVRELWKLKADPEEFLPTLAELLGHRLVSVRLAAVAMVTEMGTLAAPTEAEVERLTTDGDEAVRRAARAALERLRGANKE